ALAARGFPQTAANTSNPRLLEAGQIFYFNIHPQDSGEPRPDLTITNIVASQSQPKVTVLTATVANNRTANAANDVVRFLDGSTLVGDSAPIATLARGASAQVSVTWDTRGIHGDRLISAVADPNNTVAESNESNNTEQRTITIRGNKVINGSFEQSANGTTPD